MRGLDAGGMIGVALLTAGVVSAGAQAAKPFHVEQRWTVGGEGGWDYLITDSAAKRLYLTHTGKVEVVDLTSGKVIGQVNGLNRTHGVIIPPDSKVGFISDGGANAIVVFDLSSLAVVGRIPAGKNPDGMVYEPATKTVWAFNGGSNDATVVDVAGRKALGTVAVGGRPEFPAADGSGSIFVNLEDKGAMNRIDAKTMKVTATWPLTGCESPSGLAVDASGERLFSVCDGKKMAVTDARTGKQLALAAIGNGPDAAGYDAGHKLAFSSNGEDGTLTVVDAGKAGYPVLQTVKTEPGARTMTLDDKTGKVYLVSAKYGKPEAGQRRPAALPGSFTVLVVGRD